MVFIIQGYIQNRPLDFCLKEACILSVFLPTGALSIFSSSANYFLFVKGALLFAVFVLQYLANSVQEVERTLYIDNLSSVFCVKLLFGGLIRSGCNFLFFFS